MSKPARLVIAFLLIAAPLSLVLKYQAAVPAGTQVPMPVTEKIDLLMKSAGFDFVGSHKLMRAETFTARIYRDLKPDPACKGEVFVISIPRNEEGTVLLEKVAQPDGGEIIYYFNGRVFATYPKWRAFIYRHFASFGMTAHNAVINTVLGVASQFPCKPIVRLLSSSKRSNEAPAKMHKQL